ncbi:MAG: putative glycoside hydrolase [Acidimicrobiia bacterium]
MPARLRRSSRRDPLAPLGVQPAGIPLRPVRARRSPRLTRERSIQWSSVAVAAGCAAVALYVLQLMWAGTRVDVDLEGVTGGEVLTSAALEERTLRFAIDPGDRAHRAVLELNGDPVPPKAVDFEGTTMVWRPGVLPEGEHKLTVEVPRPALWPSAHDWKVTVDDTPPRLDVPPPAAPVGLCAPLTLTGRVERGAALTVNGAPTEHDGTFRLRYHRPPAAPVHVEATDAAGNRSSVEVMVPVAYPGGQGVHVTAAAWGYEPLRRGILSLIDAKLVSAVQLDLKDEGGIVGYDSNVALARQIGAVRPEYRLREAVADLRSRGVRVIGRIVAFRDPQLAAWAWANDRRDWVVHSKEGGLYGGYGGFANPVHPDVHRYNLDIALEAADAGVDDIMWDYIRRPEGDPEEMVIPGLQGASADGVVRFLATSGAALRERCVYQGAAVFGIAASRPDAIGQDIPRMARHVNYLSPMVYPSHWVPGEYRVANPNRQPYDIVKASLADFQAEVAGTGAVLMPWLQDFTLGHPYGPAEVRAQIDAAVALGIPDWLLWNAGATYTPAALHPSLVRLRE